MLGCEFKYTLRKIHKERRDPDAPMDTLALDLGCTLHDVLEAKRHELAGLHTSTLKAKMIERDVDMEWYPMLWAMLGKYKDLHEKSGLYCELVEAPIKTDDFIGFIDAVMIDDDSKWWIVDVKTAAMVNKFLPQTLPRDKQLNLYYAFFDPSEAGLNWDDFGGCRYRVVTKSKLKRKKDDTDSTYSKRMYESMQAVEYVIPKEVLNPEHAKEEFEKLRMRQKQLWELPQRAKRNYNNCVSYFRPCEYWSKCHGTEYSAEPRVQEITA
jgi:hypothetical protein